MEITSINNPLVKETVKLQQKKYRTKKFLLEGFKAVEGAYNSDIEIDYVFVLAQKADEYKFLGEKIILTTEQILKKISTTDSAPESVGVAFKKEFDREILYSAKKVVLLEGIKDAGNLGTILRTAAAFGVEAVVLYGESVDLYNPKCVRAAVGNLWKLPVFEMNNFQDLTAFFHSFNRIATLPLAKNCLKNFSTKFPCLIMFGSEADGLSDELKNFATKSIKIEMADGLESLNLSVACAIVLYNLFGHDIIN